MNLSGKTALITGAGTGIGRAIALQLSQKGVNIAINYSRSEADAQAVLEQVKWLGVSGLLVKANVAHDVEVRQMAKDVLARFGTIDYVINNAGTTDFVDLNDLEGLKDEHWERAFGVNTKGVFYTSRACAGELRKSRGCIVNIISTAALTGVGSSIAYAASKAAALSITKSLAKVMAPEVRVNAILPGIVQTRWVAGKEEHVRKYGEDTPLGRVAAPEDIAEVALSLIQGAGFVTGQSIVVDGGRTMIS